MSNESLLKDLIGNTYLFYGSHISRFKLDDTIYECICDPDDGWRSYMGDFKVVSNSEGLYPSPIAKVKVEYNCER